MGNMSRIAAAMVAAVAVTGLGVQFVVSCRKLGSVLQALWVLFAYFTITTNVLVALVFVAIASGRTRLRDGWVVAGTILSIVLVGVIYGVLLHGMVELSGGSQLANVLNHMVTPILAPMYWILFTLKGQLRWRDPGLWAIYPLAYFVYALSRGAATRAYPYPFMDVARYGARQVTCNAAIIAAGFLLCSFALVFVDQRMGRHRLARRDLVPS
jgi:hypothetical protein